MIKFRFIRAFSCIPALALLLIVIVPFRCLAQSVFDPHKASFSAKVKEHVSPYLRMSFFILPKEQVDIEIISGRLKEEFSITAPSGKLMPASGHPAGRFWQWQAPEAPGHYPVSIEAKGAKEAMTLLFFVQIPYEQFKNKEYLNNYRIGKYPRIPLRNLPIYQPPKGFAKVDPEDGFLQLSPHFTMDQFLCKQDSGFPKYIVLRTKLLLKLELLLEAVNKRGYRCDSFNILSGYRTPYYNKSIGNVKYSRHVWGGAADIFIDENPKDGYMDDLNGDGIVNWRDAEVIYNVVDDLYGKTFYEMFVGGLGWYRKTSSHGPFVHVDVRGSRVRWGD